MEELELKGETKLEDSVKEMGINYWDINFAVAQQCNKM